MNSRLGLLADEVPDSLKNEYIGMLYLWESTHANDQP